ncbi:MAG TPA: BON domain-containing protein [Burkholderiales bacterium]|nr:BON domain-containing protein [Burkholderiales bacterium]
MTTAQSKRIFRLTGAAAGAALLGLAACGQEAPSPTTPPASRQPANSAAPMAAVPAAPVEGKSAAASESDRALARRVKDALLARPALKGHGIDITARGGAVTLFGTADSVANRKLAGDIAAGIEGVNSVENKLVVASGS